MWITNQVKIVINYLRNPEIDIRVRMLFLLENAAFLACIVGTLTMLPFAPSIVTLLPNFAMIIFSCLGIYFSYVKKKYDLATNLIIIGCAYITLPIMYFTAGGYRSGMPIWFVFGIVFTCMMAKAKYRSLLTVLTIIVESCCLLLEHFHPEWVIQLNGEDAAFWDMFQSFVIVSVVVFASVSVYIATYEKQRILLVKNGNDLKNIMNVDALTGIGNRRAYYEDIAEFKDIKCRENLVLASLDVNGLKNVNDTYGHSAGDNFLINASNIIVNALSEYGKIYRVGGDEFMAVLFCSDDVAEKLTERLERAIEESDNKEEWDMAIASGFALWNKNSNMTFDELEKVADELMYQHKSEYYRSIRYDRRKS